MNAELMMEHIKFNADCHLTRLGLPVLYGIKETPFDWMTIMDIKT